MSVNLSFIGGAGWQFFTDNGAILSGGMIYTYAAGGTTPLATYTDRTGATPNANPIILDAAGRTPSQVWSTEGLLYKYVVKTSTDTTIRSWDNIGGSVVASDLAQDLASGAVNKGSSLVGYLPAGTGAVATNVQSELRKTFRTSNYTTFANALTAASGGVLLIDSNVTISVATVLPIDVIISMIRPYYFTVNTGITLTIQGKNFEAGNYHCFLGTGSVVFVSGESVVPFWFGAVGDDVTDDAVPLQKWIDSVVTNSTTGGKLYLPAGNFRTSKKLVIDGGNKPFELYGNGPQTSTIIAYSATLPNDTAVLSVGGYGPEGIVRDLQVSGDRIGGTFTAGAALLVGGNGMYINNLWLGACYTGLTCTTGFATNRINNIQSEHNYYNYFLTGCVNNTFTNCASYRAIISGFHIVKDYPYAGAAQNSPGANSFIGCTDVEHGVGGDESGAAFYISTTITPTVISGCMITNFNQAKSNIGIKTGSWEGIQHTGDVIVSGCAIDHMTHYGIYAPNGGNITVTGCSFNRIGWVDLTTPHLVAAISIGANLYSATITGNNFNTIAGYGIVSDQATTILITGNLFNECAKGGSEGGGVNVTVGNAYICLNPTASYKRSVLIGNSFYGTVPTGKSAIKIEGTVPSIRGAIKIISNTVTDLTTVDTGLSTTWTNAQVANLTLLHNEGLNIGETPLNIGAWGNTEAPYSALFFSSTSSKLSWKDSIGTVHELY